MSGQPADAVFPNDPGASDRHACEVPTTCQPPSSWCKDPWPATIRDISTVGLSLTLARRFERGAGLAVELPAGDGASTVLARVVQIKAHPDGWELACDFISELSDEEVHSVLQLDPLHQAACADAEAAAPASHAVASIYGVLFQARIHPGDYLRWYVKRLDLAAAWPLAGDKVVSLRVGGLAGAPPVKLKVKNCRLFGSSWIVDCKLCAVPSDEVLRVLACPAPPESRSAF